MGSNFGDVFSLTFEAPMRAKAQLTFLAFAKAEVDKGYIVASQSQVPSSRLLRVGYRRSAVAGELTRKMPTRAWALDTSPISAGFAKAGGF